MFGTKDKVPGLTCNLIGKTHSRVVIKNFGLENDNGSAHRRIKRRDSCCISATEVDSCISTTLKRNGSQITLYFASKEDRP